MIKVESILELYWNLAGIFSGGMIGLFLMGYFSKRANNLSAKIGVVLGLAVIIWMSLSPVYFKGEMEKYGSPFHNYLTIVFGTLVIFLTGFLVSTWVSRFKSLKSK